MADIKITASYRCAVSAAPSAGSSGAGDGGYSSSPPACQGNDKKLVYEDYLHKL